MSGGVAAGVHDGADAAPARRTSAELMDGSASGHGDALATLIGAIRGQAAIGIRGPEGTGGAMPMAAAPMARAAKTAVVFFTSGSNVVVFGCANRRSAACARYDTLYAEFGSPTGECAAWGRAAGY